MSLSNVLSNDFSLSVSVTLLQFECEGYSDVQQIMERFFFLFLTFKFKLSSAV